MTAAIFCSGYFFMNFFLTNMHFPSKIKSDFILLGIFEWKGGNVCNKSSLFFIGSLLI